jgi:3-dehydroquinate dehydratase/shikimate dehydrogenase
MTQLCGSIFVESAEQARRDALLAAEAGADMLELRLDLLVEPMELPEMPLPYIATCRPTREGGLSLLNDSARLDLIDACAQQAAYIDIELDTYVRRPDISDFSRYPRRLIVSTHDFKGRPPIPSRLVEMAERRAEVHKIVWMARSVRDNIEAFELLQQRIRPTIALCMGEAGLISRVLAKKFGAFLTYVSLRPEEATAPGQPTIEQIKRLYRWDSIQADTKVYGVVGCPIAHSLSPAVHNAAFDESGENAVYLPMLVQSGYESFKAFMEEFLAFAPLDLSGLSITIPHKENALRYLREKGAQIDPLCDEAGSVNTIVISASTLRGFNTDYDAIVQTLCTTLRVQPEALGDLRIAVIGAGGTARTAVAALAKLGATIVVYNRTREKGEQIAREFDGKIGKVVAARLEKLCDSCCHIFINATPIGMHPDVEASPFGDRIPNLSSETLAFDTIYNPPKTKLLQQAEAAGARTVGGMEMFIRQAARQFEIWSGKSAPVATMRRAADSSLVARV